MSASSPRLPRLLLLLLLLFVCVGQRGAARAGSASCLADDEPTSNEDLLAGQENVTLNCPINGNCSSSQCPVVWLKDCQTLNLSVEGHVHAIDVGLHFVSVALADSGNYTCHGSGNLGNSSHTIILAVKELTAAPCMTSPSLLSPPGPERHNMPMGASLSLNCTVEIGTNRSDVTCPTSVVWRKDGIALPSNSSAYNITVQDARFSDELSAVVITSRLSVSTLESSNFGAFGCHFHTTAGNISASFVVAMEDKGLAPSHVVSAVAALVLLLLLALSVALYSRFKLDLQLWHRNTYGDFETNDGKLYDAYVSYVNTEFDRKFVHFTLRPHLEMRYGYRLHTDDKDILPGLEPSPELLMNLSRCRRLIVVLSGAYLAQEWCSEAFREGLLRLQELTPRPVFITFDDGRRAAPHPALQLLHLSRPHPVVLPWDSTSATATSKFWKQLCLALPKTVEMRHFSVGGGGAGDPQVQAVGDRDPMLMLNPEYLDSRGDGLDGGGRQDSRRGRAGDGVAEVAILSLSESTQSSAVVSRPNRGPEELDPNLDIETLESRNYGVRRDFYCLVTEQEI
ncbi:unnamed protein product [Lampetra planeri]